MENKPVFYIGEEIITGNEAVFSWQNSDNLVAVCGTIGLVHILDRQGKKYKQLALSENRPVREMEWDREDEVIAVLQEKVSYVTVWDINTLTFTQLEIGSNDQPSFIKWSRTQAVLAIGTEKGGVVFYNKSTQRKIPTIGKHSMKVIAGDWSTNDLLITGSEDKTLTISTMTGDTIPQTSQIRSQPLKISWENPKTVMMIVKDTCINTIWTSEGYISREITLQHHYGRILNYECYGEDKMAVGCSEGWVAVISLGKQNFGSELFSVKMFNITFDSMCFSKSQLKVALAGDSTVRFLNLLNFKEAKSDKIEMQYELGRVNKLHWTDDGQILTVLTSVGKLMNYLIIVPCLSSSYGTLASILTSLTEVTIFECVGGVRISNKVKIDSEPSSMALGPYHLAILMNTSAWFYRWKTDKEIFNGGVCVKKMDYSGIGKAVVINSAWAAVLNATVVTLHLIESDKVEKQFADILCIAITANMLILADTSNKIRCFSLEDLNYVSEIRFDSGVSNVFPNSSGTRIVVKDITGGGYLYTAVNETKLTIPNFSSNVNRVLWDEADLNMFITCETEKLTGYLYSPITLYGPNVDTLRELLSIEDLDRNTRDSVTMLEKGQKPLVLYKGIVFCHSESQGNIKGNFLSSHTYLSQWRGKNDTPEGHYKYFLQNLVLKRFKACYPVAERLGGIKIPEVLGKLALQNLDLEVAEKAYQLSKNVGMVYSINAIKQESEKQVLLGFVAMILHQHDIAQELFMKSSQPKLALEMRCDLQDWLIAMQLSRTTVPHMEPIICKNLASQVETQGNYIDALKLFEKASSTMEASGLSQAELNAYVAQCYAGVARNSIRSGDINRGYKIALELNDNQLKVDCAQVCESLKHFSEAAQLYHKGGQLEKAASLYIKMKKWKEASELMDVINTPKLLIQLAKAKEAENNFKEAEIAYEKAGDYENVIKINLGPLDNPERAKSLIKNKCMTQTAASMMADYYEKKGQKENAMEFLILAEKKEDAFVLAQSFDLMEKYAELILQRDNKNPEEHIKIAQFFEGKNKPGKAALHYEKAENLQKSLQLFMHAGEEFYSSAIKMASRVKSDLIFMQLYDFFMGEIDGIPKDPKFIYELNLVMGKLKEAANTAIIIASEEQEAGNYKAAHDRLFETIRDMRFQKLKVPQLMDSKLMIIHSYVLVKWFVKVQDHYSAAKLLVRVAKNISQFPAHSVQILTTTVVECMRANLKEAAYTWACILMRPEHRPFIDERFKKQIEKVAIKRPKGGDPEEPSSPCPFCSAYVLDYDLECESCKNNLPFCIASGKHLQLASWSQCPKCNFPAILQEISKCIESDGECPMCSQKISTIDLALVKEPLEYYKADYSDLN
jgi:WD repeat-containing protein 19